MSTTGFAVSDGWTMAREGVLATLRAGWNALGDIRAPKALIGGLALTAWNHARYTRDAEATMLLRENRDSIDFQRLHQAVYDQGLLEDYRAIWSDAYPGDPVPDLSG